MGWIDPESVRLDCPLLDDKFVRREPSEGLEPPAEVVCVDEVRQVLFELIVAVVMVALDGGFLDRPIHSLDLAVRPGMLDLGEPVLDIVFATDTIEDVETGIYMPFVVRKLDAVVGEHGMDGIREQGD